MAAHLKTGLEQTIEDLKAGKLDKNAVSGAVNLSCWTVDTWDGWNALKSWLNGEIDDQELLGVLEIELEKATAEWEAYGRPATREAWHEAKYGENFEAWLR